MEWDHEKIDRMILALMYLGLHDEHRVWKTFDWACLNRLFEQGLMSNPVGKAKSVLLTEEGKKRSEELFQKYFCY